MSLCATGSKEHPLLSGNITTAIYVVKENSDKTWKLEEKSSRN